MLSYSIILILFLILKLSVCFAFDPNDVIFAINAGGNAFIDSLGIKYEKDPLHRKLGVASDYGRSLTIKRIPEEDFELYQIERYHHHSFGYDITIPEDGNYVLVLKFCEVYFNAKNLKVFDVTLNGLKILENLDIFNKVGKGVAYDEYIPFRIKDSTLMYGNMELFINNRKIRVEFIKGKKDNPKINAIVIYKGKIEDYPKLPAINSEDKLKYNYQEIKYFKNIKFVNKGRSYEQVFATTPTTLMWSISILMFVFFTIFYTSCHI